MIRFAVGIAVNLLDEGRTESQKMSLWIICKRLWERCEFGIDLSHLVCEIFLQVRKSAISLG